MLRKRKEREKKKARSRVQWSSHPKRGVQSTFNGLAIGNADKSSGWPSIPGSILVGY